MSEFPLVDADPADPDSEAADSAVRHASIAPEPVPAVEAARWLGRWGEQDAQATSEVTVHALQAVALVCSDVRVGRAELNDLVEYASAQPHIRRLYLFSDVPFGSRVASMAEESGVALFWWDETGALQPIGVLAHQRSGTVPARAATSQPVARPAGGARRRDVATDAVAEVRPVEPEVAPIVETVVEAPVGKRRAAVPTDSPTTREIDLDPVLANVLSPLPEVALPPGDPLFTPLRQETEPELAVTAPEPAAELPRFEAVEPRVASRTNEESAVRSAPERVDLAAEVVDVVQVSDQPVASASPEPAVVEPPTVETPVAAKVQVPEPAPAPQLNLEPVEERSPQDAQIARYLDLLHNRAAAHGVTPSRRARVATEGNTPVLEESAMSVAPAAPRRFADPTRRVAGGPDAAARTAASHPDAPIAGLTPEMIFPTQQAAPLQERIVEPEAPPVVPAAPTEGAPVEERGKVRGWFSRRQQARDAEPGAGDTAPAKSAPAQRSYQMRRTMEARRVMLETGLTPVTDVPEAMEWLRGGDRARAIAAYRKAVGVGLVEAIDALDALGGDY